MAEVIDLEELRRIGVTLRRMQADQDTGLSRMDGLERRLAIIEERQAEVEVAIRLLGRELEQLDRKLDAVIALVREDVAGLERRLGARLDAMDRRLDAMDQRFDAVDGRLDAMDRRFDAVDGRLDAIDRRFDAVDGRLDAMDRRFDEVLAAIAAIGSGRG